MNNPINQDFNGGKFEEKENADISFSSS